MAQLTAAQKRLFLRYIYKNLSGTLEDDLWALFATDRVTEIISGKAIIETEGEDWRTKFQFMRGINPADMAELAGELIDEYDTCLALLGGSATDLAIYTEMLDRIQPITSITKDYSNLRYATGGAVS